MSKPEDYTTMILGTAYRPAEQIDVGTVTPPPSVDWAEVGPGLLDALRRAEPLMRMLTIGQIIGGGDDAISASGMNPWCINEGLADSTERYNAWWLGAAIARATPGGETGT